MDNTKKHRVEYCFQHGTSIGYGKPCWHCLRPMDSHEKRECTWVDHVREKMRLEGKSFGVTVVNSTTDQKIESLIKEVGRQAIFDYLHKEF